MLLVPHTSEWFEFMLLRDTVKAVHTMKVIELSNGDVNVCGICGDVPAHDYVMLEYITAEDKTVDMRNVPDADKITQRMCDDCVVLRGHLGENSERISL